MLKSDPDGSTSWRRRLEFLSLHGHNATDIWRLYFSCWWMIGFLANPTSVCCWTGLTDGGGGKVNKEARGAVAAAEAAGIPVSTLPKHDLNMLSDNRPHQVHTPIAPPQPAPGAALGCCSQLGHRCYQMCRPQTCLVID